MAVSGLGNRAGIPIIAAIAVEVVNGLAVAGVRVTAADVAGIIAIAGDVVPGRPGRSPVG